MRPVLLTLNKEDWTKLKVTFVPHKREEVTPSHPRGETPRQDQRVVVDKIREQSRRGLLLMSVHRLPLHRRSQQERLSLMRVCPVDCGKDLP